MAQLEKPSVECRQQQVILPVSDIHAAIDYYTNKLGFSAGFTWGDPLVFAGINLGKVELFLSSGLPQTNSGTVCFSIEDADELFAYHQSNEVEVLETIADRSWGIRDYSIRDPYGNTLIFGHYIYNTGPAIKIEREDLHLRLEKRLIALLKDLAVHKRMSVDSCLEETLLHTFEPFGDGVASPHTKRTLQYIQELKKKHGIDYDVHGSYRFVE